MAKKTTQELVNEIMRRIQQADTSNVATATGHARVALGYLNDAIIEIYNKANGRWYSLLQTRRYKTSNNALITLVDFSLIALDTITITFNGTAVVLTEGTDFSAVTSNETTASNIATAITAASGLGAVVGTSEGVEATARAPVANLDGITAVDTSAPTTGLTIALDDNGEYALASDFGAFFVVKDITNNRIIPSEWDKIIDLDDPDEDSSGTILIYSVRKDHVRMYPKPDSVVVIKEAYWQLVTRLTANSTLYDLPEFCETAILKVAEAETWYYLDKNSKGDRARGRAKILIEDAMETNDSILDRILMLEADFTTRSGRLAMIPPSLGSNFSHPHGF